MEHPVITNMMTTGEPDGKYPVEMGYDSLGNLLYKGDDILTIDDLVFSVTDISYESKEILELLGADRRTI